MKYKHLKLASAAVLASSLVAVAPVATVFANEIPSTTSSTVMNVPHTYSVDVFKAEALPEIVKHTTVLGEFPTELTDEKLTEEVMKHIPSGYTLIKDITLEDNLPAGSGEALSILSDQVYTSTNPDTGVVTHVYKSHIWFMKKADVLVEDDSNTEPELPKEETPVVSETPVEDKPETPTENKPDEPEIPVGEWVGDPYVDGIQPTEPTQPTVEPTVKKIKYVGNDTLDKGVKVVAHEDEGSVTYYVGTKPETKDESTDNFSIIAHYTYTVDPETGEIKEEVVRAKEGKVTVKPGETPSLPGKETPKEEEPKTVTEPVNSKETPKEEQKVKAVNTTNANTSSKTETKKELPKTGESSSILSLIGGLISTTATGLLKFKKKED